MHRAERQLLTQLRKFATFTGELLVISHLILPSTASAKIFPATTIHTRRTLMFSELARVMNHAGPTGDFGTSLGENVVAKQTKVNIDKTNQLLRQLYTFDYQHAPFRAFAYFWSLASETDQRIMALLFALEREPLLAESADLVLHTRPGDSVTVEQLRADLDHRHPGRYNPGTARSVAQRLASSWKQAGYLAVKTLNQRLQPQPQRYAVTFALLLAYLNGDRGEFILRSPTAQALGLSEMALREAAADAARHDLLQYQASGVVTAFAFPQLITVLHLHGL